jgi:type IV pilus assembly protein PilE
MKFNANLGFTLIEIMIAVAIVGILSAIAIPSYSEHIKKGSRAAAQSELLILASMQEKIYLNDNAYTGLLSNAYSGRITGGLGKTSDKTDDGKYDISITTTGTPPSAFTITATPSSGKQQAGNGCLTINENGLREWFKGNDACGGTATAW